MSDSENQGMPMIYDEEWVHLDDYLTLKAQLEAAERKAAAVFGALGWSLDVLDDTEEMLRIATNGFSDTLPHAETDRAKSLARRLLVGKASASNNEWQAYALFASASDTGSEEGNDG